MKTIRPLHIIVVVLLLNLTSAAYAGKYALIIGNGSYKDAPLSTPVNDAEVMASTLRSLGFSVSKETDISHRTMEQAIRDFGNRLSPGDTALFYFSGHGAQADGSNYLIPIGADIQSEDEIKHKSVAADIVLAKMKSARSAVNIIILDACRNNPFKGFKSMGNGLAPMAAVKGTFIAYATAPGTVAYTGNESTSIYTKYLTNLMKKPGLKIEDVFKRVRESVISDTSDKQIPWEASSLTGKDFYFNGEGGQRQEQERETPYKPEVSESRTSSASDKTFTNSLGMKFVRIPAGSFMMGSPSGEPGHESDETQHRVSISNSFYMQTTEVTQGQWKAVMGSNPSKFTDCGDNCPVENVSWDDVQGFIKKLNQKGEGTYRLPTEAEWEYAARAGTTTPFSFGDCLAADQANYDGNNPLSGCPKGAYRQKTVRVGSFAPNAWGLYDMHGNVWEWCADWKGDYPSGDVTDPTGPSSSSYRVLRGGGWYDVAWVCRPASRDYYSPGGRDDSYGFRLVRP